MIKKPTAVGDMTDLDIGQLADVIIATQKKKALDAAATTLPFNPARSAEESESKKSTKKADKKSAKKSAMKKSGKKKAAKKQSTPTAAEDPIVLDEADKEALDALRAAAEFITGSSESPAAGLPVEVIVEDGVARHVTLEEFAERPDEELAEDGWTDLQIKRLRYETEPVKITIGKDQRPRFVDVKSKENALADRARYEEELKDFLVNQGYRKEMISEVVDSMFRIRTAEEPEVVPVSVLAQGGYNDEAEVGQVLKDHEADLADNWGF